MIIWNEDLYVLIKGPASFYTVASFYSSQVLYARKFGIKNVDKGGNLKSRTRIIADETKCRQPWVSFLANSEFSILFFASSLPKYRREF